MNLGNTVRWGIIGCGDVAENKSGPPLYQTPNSELVAVVRRDAAKAADFARRHGARRWYSDVNALLADPEVNAVYIASPHYLHVEHVTLAVQAGKAAILCEKPMGTGATAAQQIVDLCRAHGIPLAVAYYRRCWPAVQKMRQLLAEGALGRIMHVRVQLCEPFTDDPGRSWLTDKGQSGGGPFANGGSHWIDLIRFLLGEVTDVQAYTSSRARGFEVEDTAALILRTADEALITYSASWGAASLNDFDITGMEGRLLVSPLSGGRLVLERVGREPEVFDMARSGPAHAEFIRDLVPRLLAGQPVTIPGEEAVPVWRIMEAAYQSAVYHPANMR